MREREREDKGVREREKNGERFFNVKYVTYNLQEDMIRAQDVFSTEVQCFSCCHSIVTKCLEK